MKIKKNLILKLTTAITAAIPFTQILTSCSKNENDFIEKDFCSDSWENIVYWANQGTDNFLKRYGRQRYGLPMSIIGKERVLTIDNVDHLVRVIGMNNDYIADSDGNPTQKTATLTFQFEEVFSYIEKDEQYQQDFINGYESHYYDNEIPETNVGYYSSSLRHFLNNDLLNKFPKSLQSSIKTVSKKELSGTKQILDYTEPDLELKNVSEKLFSLSLAEIFPQEYLVDLNPFCTNEGQIYDWYSLVHNMWGYYDLNETTFFPLIKWTAAGPECGGTAAWFLRTIGLYPKTTEEGTLKYLVTNSCISGAGKPTTSPNQDNWECLLPCFCI